MPIRPRVISDRLPSISRMAAAWIWCRPARSGPALSRHIWSCATIRWCRRRRRSISSPLRCRARCRTRRRPVRNCLPDRQMAMTSICLACRPAMSCMSLTRTISPASHTTCRSFAWMIRRCCRWRTAPRSIQMTRCLASIFPVAWHRWSRNSMPRWAPALACSSPTRQDRRCAYSMTVQ